jgi:hypothetical protein
MFILLVPASGFAADSPSPEWRSIAITTSHNDFISILLSDDGSTIRRLELRQTNCQQILENIQILGSAYLYDVGFHNYSDRIDVLTIPYFDASGESKDVHFYFEKCKLIKEPFER